MNGEDRDASRKRGHDSHASEPCEAQNDPSKAYKDVFRIRNYLRDKIERFRALEDNNMEPTHKEIPIAELKAEKVN